MNGIVIQGPTDYYKNILDFWASINNQHCEVVWSTWDSEPSQNLKAIKKSGIKVIESPLPKFEGYLNVNYQCKSTYEGLLYFKKKGIKNIIKVRSDITWEGIESFLPYIENKRIGFLGINNRQFEDIIEGHDLGYFLDYNHTHQDYPSDMVICGNVDYLLTTFNLEILSNNNTPPEAMILWNYLKSHNFHTSFYPENLEQAGVYLFAKDTYALGNKISWWKNGWDLVGLHNNPWEKYII